MGAVASQITSLTIVNSTVYSGEDKKTHQNSTSLAFVRGIRQQFTYHVYQNEYFIELRSVHVRYIVTQQHDTTPWLGYLLL